MADNDSSSKSAEPKSPLSVSLSPIKDPSEANSDGSLKELDKMTVEELIKELQDFNWYPQSGVKRSLLEKTLRNERVKAQRAKERAAKKAAAADKRVLLPEESD